MAKNKNEFMKATKGLGHHDLSANLPVDEDLQKEFKKIVFGKGKKYPYDIDLSM